MPGMRQGAPRQTEFREVAKMDSEQNITPAMQLVEVCDESPDAIVEHEVVLSDADEKELSTEEITALTTKRLRWCCWMAGCSYRFRVRLDQMDAMPFFIVRHLVKDHGLRSWEIIAAEPLLADEVRKYVESVGIEPPVTDRTGGSTKMESPR